MAQQPPVTPPPPPGSQPPAGYGAPQYGQYGPGPAGAKPPGVTGAGVTLIIAGVLWALLGAIIGIAGGAIVGSFSEAGGAVIGIAVLIVAMGVLDIISGVKVIGLNAGWRIGGIVLAAIGSLLSLLFLLGSFQGQDELQIDPSTFEISTVSSGPNIGGLILSLVLLGVNVAALIMVARTGRAFQR
jgi:hypothetical protein